jgi:hypothetical protein
MTASHPCESFRRQSSLDSGSVHDLRLQRPRQNLVPITRDETLIFSDRATHSKLTSATAAPPLGGAFFMALWSLIAV